MQECKVKETKEPLQGKYLLAEVITEVFNVIKLARIVKNIYAKTSICGNGCFSEAYNGTSSQLKDMGAQTF